MAQNYVSFDHLHVDLQCALLQFCCIDILPHALSTTEPYEAIQKTEYLLFTFIVYLAKKKNYICKVRTCKFMCIHVIQSWPAYPW